MTTKRGPKEAAKEPVKMQTEDDLEEDVDDGHGRAWYPKAKPQESHSEAESQPSPEFGAAQAAPQTEPGIVCHWRYSPDINICRRCHARR